MCFQSTNRLLRNERDENRTTGRFSFSVQKGGTCLKKYHILLLTFMLLALTGCSATEAIRDTGVFSREKVLPKKEIELVALGDSLTVGVGDEKDAGGYVGRLAKEMPEKMDGVEKVNITQTAKKGRRSDQLLTQLKSGEINDALKKADIITMTIGGNDLMKILRENFTTLERQHFDTERSNYEKRYIEIFKLIRAQNQTAPIIAVGVYNPLTVYAEDTSEFEKILDEWNQDMKNIVEKDAYAIFVPTVDLFHTNKAEVYSDDYFHPNAKGYTNMKNRIFETLDTVSVYKKSNGRMKMKGETVNE